MRITDIFRGKKKQPVAGSISKDKEWKEFEYFDESWKSRIQFMAQYIHAGESVMDLGCGRMWLKEFISGSQYIPVDYTSRNADTIVCDFNKKEFPQQNTDVIFVSGCMEYIRDYKWFIDSISKHCKRCVICYCAVDEVPGKEHRDGCGWVNSLSKEEIKQAFAAGGMGLKTLTLHGHTTSVFVFEK